MLSEKVFPSSVTEFDQSLGRLNDIREQDAGEYAVGFAFNFTALAGQECFNFTKDGIRVPHPWIVIYAGELHIPCLFNVPGEVTTMLDIDGITNTMQNQCGRANRR